MGRAKRESPAPPRAPRLLGTWPRTGSWDALSDGAEGGRRATDRTSAGARLLGRAAETPSLLLGLLRGWRWSHRWGTRLGDHRLAGLLGFGGARFLGWRLAGLLHLLPVLGGRRAWLFLLLGVHACRRPGLDVEEVGKSHIQCQNRLLKGLCEKHFLSPRCRPDSKVNYGSTISGPSRVGLNGSLLRPMSVVFAPWQPFLGRRVSSLPLTSPQG